MDERCMTSDVGGLSFISLHLFADQLSYNDERCRRAEG